MQDEDSAGSAGFTHVSDLFGKKVEVFSKLDISKATENGELLRYFAKKLRVTIPRVAGMLAYLSALDKDERISAMYALKSDCDQAAARGVPWGAAFRTAIKMP